MSRYYDYDDDGDWPTYVSAAERRFRAAREAQKLGKKGRPVEPVTIEGRRIASTFWGKAWCDNMESYRDFESRLPRGRSYVRNGSVLDLQIAPGKVTALVSGSDLYRVAVDITPLSKQKWKAIRADCSGGIDSLVELLQGKLSKSVMERLCRQDAGLFPKPSEIRFSCSCPDFASMCKHVAAALYGVGARLDHKPELLFRLRAVHETELVAEIDVALPISRKDAGSDKMLESGDLSALFGLEMASPSAIEQAAEDARPPRSRRAASKRASATVKAAASRKRGLPGSDVAAGRSRPARQKQQRKRPGPAQSNV
ncbi:MAG: SWIM zinc finger family protein [Reyranella sp.]|nr:SWIM zinc finger family protein [Reyranella sp.]